MLQAALSLIQQRAARIEEPELRHAYYTQMPVHQQILTAANGRPS